MTHTSSAYDHFAGLSGARQFIGEIGEMYKSCVRLDSHYCDSREQYPITWVKPSVWCWNIGTQRQPGPSYCWTVVFPKGRAPTELGGVKKLPSEDSSANAATVKWIPDETVNQMIHEDPLLAVILDSNHNPH